jgi:hypothetical protein
MFQGGRRPIQQEQGREKLNVVHGKPFVGVARACGAGLCQQGELQTSGWRSLAPKAPAAFRIACIREAVQAAADPDERREAAAV